MRGSRESQLEIRAVRQVGVPYDGELIRAIEGAHNTLLGLEKKGEQEFKDARTRYGELAQRAEEMKRRGLPDTDTPEVKE